MPSATVEAGNGRPQADDPLHAEVAGLRATFRSGRTRPLAWRRKALRSLVEFLEAESGAIAEAVHEDLGRPAAETLTSEVGLIRLEARHALKHLEEWAAARPVSVPLFAHPARAWTEPEPAGTVLILGPWNYPFQLLLVPLVSALAAGNTILLKPSELAPASAALLAERLGRYMDDEALRVVEGDADVARTLVALPFDHIFFTGGIRIGRAVAHAAAERLVPVTLELGGSSPALVDASADLEVAARRIAWGRFLNAGQTCVAPNHVLVERSVADPLLEALRRATTALYGPDARLSPDYGRIVNAHHFARLEHLLEGHTPWLGGRTDPAERYIEPTIVWDPDPSSLLVQDEIFGPILPVLPVASLESAVAFVADRPAPLAVYLFTSRRGVPDTVRDRTRSGSLVVNDVVLQAMVPDLPFGGVGPSGHGRAHGRAGFDTFSIWRAHLRRSTAWDPALRYPPYSKRALAWFRRLF